MVLPDYEIQTPFVPQDKFTMQCFVKNTTVKITVFIFHKASPPKIKVPQIFDTRSTFAVINTIHHPIPGVNFFL